MADRDLNDFSKIIKDLLNDLVTSFPELATQFNDDLNNIHKDREEKDETRDEIIKESFCFKKLYCISNLFNAEISSESIRATIFPFAKDKPQFKE